MSVKALTFDTIGTVVDYRSVILREGAELNKAKDLSLDWPALVVAWRKEERQCQEKVERGEWPWTDRDAIHRHCLDDLIPRGALSEAELEHLNQVWDRADPWPDVLEGLGHLRKRHILACLSNGTLSSLVRLARHAGLPWDVILSADLFKAYKPNPKVYEEAVRLLGLSPDEVMMVAAHVYDLRAARAAGLKVAFVARPSEWDFTADPDFDIVATDFRDLARQLE
jgi:2-haloacid dehalogenase